MLPPVVDFVLFDLLFAIAAPYRITLLRPETSSGPARSVSRMTVTRWSQYPGIGNRASGGRVLGAPARVADGDDHWLSVAGRQSALDLEAIDPETWLALGECYSKCAHFIHSPLLPEWLDDLTRQQVGEAIDALQRLAAADGSGSRQLPDELRELERERVHRRSLGLTVQGMHALHTRLHGTPLLSASAVAGLRVLCDRLDGPAFRHHEPEVNFALGFIRAVAAHHALVQLRPFGAASAATARVIEVALLLELDEISIRQAGLLSIHYARTSDAYARLVHDGARATAFIDYAAAGLRDALRAQMHGSRTFFPERRAELFRHNAGGQSR